jgi:hypothetical protein
MDNVVGAKAIDILKVTLLSETGFALVAQERKGYRVWNSRFYK